MEEIDEVQKLIDEKIELGEYVIEKLENSIHIEGARRAKSFVIKEVQFLKKLKHNCDENSKLKVQCSNLNFYYHLVECVRNYKINHKILSMFDERKKHVGSDDGNDSKFRVDILCEDKETKQQLWVKVIARSSAGISDEVAGNCSFGTKNILDVAEEYLELAPHFFTPNFRPPKIVFDFLHKINENLESDLEDMGIIIGLKYRNGEVILTDCEQSNDSPLNLDVTAMLAYVSELSNGGCDAIFNEKVLNVQAEEEQKYPVKRFLDKTFGNKRLIACDTASEAFQKIVETLAGEKERKRAVELLERVEVMPDVDNPEKIINAESTHRVRDRTRKIFAFGIYHKAFTVTSNNGFIRAVKYLNLNIPAIIHSPRALTEQKAREVDNL